VDLATSVPPELKQRKKSYSKKHKCSSSPKERFLSDLEEDKGMAFKHIGKVKNMVQKLTINDSASYRPSSIRLDDGDDDEEEENEAMDLIQKCQNFKLNDDEHHQDMRGTLPPTAGNSNVAHPNNTLSYLLALRPVVSSSLLRSRIRNKG